MSVPKWVTLPEYMRMTGISRETFYILYEKKEVTAVKTEGGQWRIKIDEQPEIQELRKEIAELTEMVSILCNHLGVKMTS